MSNYIPADGTHYVKVNGNCEQVIAWFIDSEEGMCPRPVVIAFGLLPMESGHDWQHHKHAARCELLEVKSWRDAAARS